MSEWYTNLCDVHCHTLASLHAYSTLEEDVKAAALRRLELLGCTDHFSSMLNRGVPFEGDSDIRGYQHFLNVNVWPRVWHGVRVLRGAEADIVDLDGNLFGHGYPQYVAISGKPYPEPLDLDERIFTKLDYVIASVHGKQFAKCSTRTQNTQMYVRALENPKVLILGHIVRSGLDIEFDPILTAARDMKKMVELNEGTLQEHPACTERFRQLAVRCAEIGCRISLGSDGHISTQVGQFDATLAMLEEIDFPPEFIMTRDKNTFKTALESSGVMTGDALARAFA